MLFRSSLRGAIKHALWHDVWTNSTHDDRDFSIARMLAWQAMRMHSGVAWPFQGKNLYALLVMGIIPRLLQSVPFSTKTDAAWLARYDPLSDAPHVPSPSNNLLQSVHKKMAQVSHLIIQQLAAPELAQFQRFWADERAMFIQEFESRCKYNRQRA